MGGLIVRADRTDKQNRQTNRQTDRPSGAYWNTKSMGSMNGILVVEYQFLGRETSTCPKDVQCAEAFFDRSCMGWFEVTMVEGGRHASGRMTFTHSICTCSIQPPPPPQ